MFKILKISSLRSSSTVLFLLFLWLVASSPFQFLALPLLDWPYCFSACFAQLFCFLFCHTLYHIATSLLRFEKWSSFYSPFYCTKTRWQVCRNRLIRSIRPWYQPKVLSTDLKYQGNHLKTFFVCQTNIILYYIHIIEQLIIQGINQLCYFTVLFSKDVISISILNISCFML